MLGNFTINYSSIVVIDEFVYGSTGNRAVITLFSLVEYFSVVIGTLTIFYLEQYECDTFIGFTMDVLVVDCSIAK